MVIPKTKDSRQARSISVVVPCLNESASIRRLLDAVAAQDYPLHQVIVADCGSTDGTLDALEEYRRDHPAFPLHFFVQRGGTISTAMNAGIQAATGEIIIRLDAHSCPIDAYIRKSVETLRETGAGVVGGVWNIVPGGTSITSRAITRAVAHPLGAGDAAYRIGPHRPGRSPVDTVPYGCYRKSTWENIGGYNEKLQTNEDYEFNYRVRMGGQQVVLDSDIHCAYFARSTLRALARQYFRYGWWKAKMLLKHPGSLRLRQAIPVGFVAGIIVLLAGSTFSESARWLLASIMLVYILALGAASLSIGLKEGEWDILPVLPAAFVTVHFAWGGGMLAHLLSLGRYPKWQRLSVSGRQ